MITSRPAKEKVHSTQGSSVPAAELVETLAAVEEVKGDQLQLVETLAAVEEVKADHLQLVETLAAVEEVKGDQL